MQRQTGGCQRQVVDVNEMGKGVKGKNLRHKMKSLAWLVWLSGLSAGLQTRELLVQFPVRAHAWVVGQVPTWGAHKRQPHIDVSVLLFVPPFPSL